MESSDATGFASRKQFYGGVGVVFLFLVLLIESVPTLTEGWRGRALDMVRGRAARPVRWPCLLGGAYRQSRPQEKVTGMDHINIFINHCQIHI